MNTQSLELRTEQIDRCLQYQYNPSLSESPFPQFQILSILAELGIRDCNYLLQDSWKVMSSEAVEELRSHLELLSYQHIIAKNGLVRMIKSAFLGHDIPTTTPRRLKDGNYLSSREEEDIVQRFLKNDMSQLRKYLESLDWSKEQYEFEKRIASFELKAESMAYSPHYFRKLTTFPLNKGRCVQSSSNTTTERYSSYVKLSLTPTQLPANFQLVRRRQGKPVPILIPGRAEIDRRQINFVNQLYRKRLILAKRRQSPGFH